MAYTEKSPTYSMVENMVTFIQKIYRKQPYILVGIYRKEPYILDGIYRKEAYI